MSQPKRRRDDAYAKEHDALESWWAGVRTLRRDAYEAGKVLDVSVPVAYHIARGPDERIKRLYVRKDFDFLYRSIIRTGAIRDWLVHLNGNSGIGKSAFLWYFIIRFAIDMRKKTFMLVYQSRDFMWKFDSNGKAEVMRKSQFPTSSLNSATWHIINQKVDPSDALGKRVLVAASPHPDNVKNAYPDRQLDTVYMYPWDRDEFNALTGLWEAEARSLEEEARQLEGQVPAFPPGEGWSFASPVLPSGPAAGDEQLDAGAHGPMQEGDACMLATKLEDVTMEDGLDRFYEDYEDDSKVTARKLKDEAELIRTRVGAASTYYSWFGGVPRRLWQLHPKKLTDIEFERLVDSSLLRTDLGKVYRAISTGAQADDISWMLLHLKRPRADGCQYSLDFASSKIKYKFTSSLTTAKRDDLRVLLDSTDPQLGALRGYIFEQEVVGKVLHSRVNAVLMIDDKHCGKCSLRTDRGQGPVNWIACGACKNWYHQLCVLPVTVPTPLKWQCQSCQGQPGDQVLTTRRLRLRYYEVDLKQALLEAGDDAINYVWRPVKKNNGGFDFVILPATLGQATTAQYHPVPFEAIKDGVAALEAWNKEHKPDTYPEKFLLSFFLSQDNYASFGYQSYRNKQRRVSNRGVRGIMQAKVLIQTFDDEQPQVEQCADVPEPSDTVEKLEELVFEPIDFQGMTMEQLKAMACENGITGYSSLRKAQLIEKLEAFTMIDEVEDLEYERRYYSRAHGAIP